MQYRRANIAGGTYFFTVNLAERGKSILIEHIAYLRNTINLVKKRHPFIVDAMVVMPDHFHLLMTLPPNDNDFAKRIMLIKAGFSRSLPKTERINRSRKLKGERGIWQRRYWEHMIRNETDYARHVDYIHYNPVKHGCVKNASEWQYTTLHQFIERKIVSPDWGRADDFEIENFGEWVVGVRASPQPTR